MQAGHDVSHLVDLHRYPVTDIASVAAQAVIRAQRRSLAEKGVAILPGFVTPEATSLMAAEASRLRPQAYLEDVWGTPYLAVPDESFPADHPRRALEHSLTWVVAYDLIPRAAHLRALYEWDPLMAF